MIGGGQINRVLVLGLGNRLLMDDGIGVLVVKALSERHPSPERVTYAIAETDFAYALEQVTLAEEVILVDAAMTGKAPGELTILPLRSVTATRAGISQHDLHFLDLLRRRGDLKRGALIGIEPARIDLGWGLSPELSQQFRPIVNAVGTAVDRLIRTSKA